MLTYVTLLHSADRAHFREQNFCGVNGNAKVFQNIYNHIRFIVDVQHGFLC